MDDVTATAPAEPNAAAAGADDDWCTINEAARRLGVTATAIRNRIKRGTLPVKPNGNYGKLVKVPRTVTLTVAEPVSDTVTGTVTGTVPEPVRDTESLTVTLTVLSAHIETLQAALTKAEAAAERGRVAELEAALLKVELAAEQQRSADHRVNYEHERERADDMVVIQSRLIAELETLRSLLQNPATMTPWRRFLRWRRAAG